MDILEQIIAVKRSEVRRRKFSAPVSKLEKSSFFAKPLPSFYDALKASGPSLIGEFKRRSPSAGDINPAADISKVASAYESAGIAGMSVLTDENFFGGSNSDLENAAGLIKIPILRKDFIIDEYQVVEARSIGASAILLIASILTSEEVRALSLLANNLGMDVLFEIHNRSDTGKICENINIIGVNNRNLSTLEVSINNSFDLLMYLPQNCIKVAESGLRTIEDILQLSENGFDAFLIGESFMKSDDPGFAASQFISNLKTALG